MKITLIRHTSLAIDPNVCYGQSNIDVSENFEDERRILQNKLAHQHFDAIYSSPLQRCVKLAEAINIGNVVQDHRLKELHFGDWEMRQWHEIPRDIFDTWAEDYANLAPPNGETFNQLQQRGIAFLNDISEQHPTGHIAVISHGGMIRAMLAHALNIPLKALFRFTIDYGSITRFDLCSSVPKVEFVNL